MMATPSPPALGKPLFNLNYSFGGPLDLFLDQGQLYTICKGENQHVSSGRRRDWGNPTRIKFTDIASMDLSMASRYLCVTAYLLASKAC